MDHNHLSSYTDLSLHIEVTEPGQEFDLGVMHRRPYQMDVPDYYCSSSQSLKCIDLLTG